uniref:Uncharacterized protein n=1 Tax=Cacopsylla melanoneura TaxID=428564 RepID=A0A8D8V8F5_9HEMI
MTKLPNSNTISIFCLQDYAKSMYIIVSYWPFPRKIQTLVSIRSQSLVPRLLVYFISFVSIEWYLLLLVSSHSLPPTWISVSPLLQSPLPGYLLLRLPLKNIHSS